MSTMADAKFTHYYNCYNGALMVSYYNAIYLEPGFVS